MELKNSTTTELYRKKRGTMSTAPDLNLCVTTKNNSIYKRWANANWFWWVKRWREVDLSIRNSSLCRYARFIHQQMTIFYYYYSLLFLTLLKLKLKHSIYNLSILDIITQTHTISTHFNIPLFRAHKNWDLHKGHSLLLLLLNHFMIQLEWNFFLQVLHPFLGRWPFGSTMS